MSMTSAAPRLRGWRPALTLALLLPGVAGADSLAPPPATVEPAALSTAAVVPASPAPPVVVPASPAPPAVVPASPAPPLAAPAPSTASAPETPQSAASAPPPVAAPLAPLEEARRDYFTARGLAEQGSHDEAVALLQRVLELAPTWSLAKLALARSLRLRGDPPEARQQLLEEAAEVDPEHHLVQYELGLVREATGRADAAVACYQKAVERRPDLTHAHERLGALLLQLGRLDEARGHLEVVTGLQPANLVALNLLAGALEGLHRVEEAEQRLLQLVALSPGQPYVILRLAAFYRRQGKAAQAGAAQDKARRLLERQQPARPRMRPLASPPPRVKRR